MATPSRVYASTMLPDGTLITGGIARLNLLWVCSAPITKSGSIFVCPVGIAGSVEVLGASAQAVTPNAKTRRAALIIKTYLATRRPRASPNQR